MTSSPKSMLSACALACFLFLVTVSLSGCLKNILPGGESDTDKPVAKLSPLDEGRNAFVKGNYGTAETIALRLVDDSSLSKADSAEAGRLLAAAALQNSHPSVALTGLERWNAAAPGADGSKEWQDTWSRALRALSSHDARTRANDLYQDAKRSASVRSVAGVVLAVRQWQDGELGQSMVALENIYAAAQNNRAKVLIEGRLATELHAASPQAAALVASIPTPENQGKFPYSVILIDKLRRQASQPNMRAEAEAALAELRKSVTLADPALFSGPPVESVLTFQATGGASPSAAISGKPVVLVLPQKDRYAPISEKIIAGAQAACDELSSSGNAFTLIVIDADQPDWTSKVDALPQNALIVGGPLRRDDYAKAKAQGLASRRVLFTFLPGLDGDDEGRLAWRFFSSAKDQVDTLLAFTSRLGVKGYGICYPEENFGRRMAALFEDRVRAMGKGKLTKVGYEPGDTNNWMAAASSLVSANNSGTAFQAVFLPDTWKNAEGIVPNFFYYNETRQVLMGTSLWEQGLTGSSVVNTQYYDLAVFPGSWNSSHPTSAGKQLQSRLSAAGKGSADIWSGLGYDFVRLSARLDVRSGWTPQSVNAALQNVSLDWSAAPMRWDNGIASQQMFLFRPKAGGFELLNEENFRNAFAEAWK